jgi:hypothetical protein
MYNYFGYCKGRNARSIDRINKLEKALKAVVQDKRLSEEERIKKIRGINTRILKHENDMFRWA